MGIQGLADVFLMLRLPYESPEARKLNKGIFETLYFAAIEASCEEAEINGSYESYNGSPISKGLFHWEMANGSVSDRWNWEELRAKISKFGIRNSLLIAPMPTAGTSQIFNNNEAFEPFTSNIYTRRTACGEFQMEIFVNIIRIYALHAHIQPNGLYTRVSFVDSRDHSARLGLVDCRRRRHLPRSSPDGQRDVASFSQVKCCASSTASPTAVIARWTTRRSEFLTIADCKKRWRSIKDAYGKIKRAQRHGTGSAAKPKSKWPLLDQLSFLEHVSSERNTQSSYTTDTSTETSCTPPEASDMPEHVMDEAAQITLPVKKKRIINNKLEELLETRAIQRDDLLNSIKTYTVDADPLNTFFKNMEATVRRMTDDMICEAKTKIFAIVSELEIRALEERRRLTENI